MTRINLVEPHQLTNEHLMAEYLELPRVFTAVEKAIAAGKKPSDFKIPERYVLGTGHVTFFYDKCEWLITRYRQLRTELLKRRYGIDQEKYDIVNGRYFQLPDCWKNNYKPTPEEIQLSMARIVNKSKDPHVIVERC